MTSKTSRRGGTAARPVAARGGATKNEASRLIREAPLTRTIDQQANEQLQREIDEALASVRFGRRRRTDK